MQNHQKSSKLAPKLACRSKFASWTPKSAKIKRKWRPRGDPWDPPRDPKIVKIRKKKSSKNHNFSDPPLKRVSDDFWAQKWSKNEPKMRSQRAEGEETAKIAKTSNLQYLPQKTPIFQGLKTYKIDKNLKKCMQRTKLAQRWPSRSDFSWFCLYFGAPRGAWNDLKTAKRGVWKKDSKKTL